MDTHCKPYVNDGPVVVCTLAVAASYTYQGPVRGPVRVSVAPQRETLPGRLPKEPPLDYLLGPKRAACSPRGLARLPDRVAGRVRSNPPPRCGSLNKAGRASGGQSLWQRGGVADLRGSKSEHGRDLPPAQTIPLPGLPGFSLSPSSLTSVSYINPSVRRLTTLSPPTIIWSWTLIPRATAAATICLVISTSALDGVGSPLG